MRSRRALVLVLAGCFATSAALLPPRPGSAAPASPITASGDRWMGVASCAAAGCHNANRPEGSRGSEYSTWSAHDRHARAFLVLHEERSQRMVRALYGSNARPATQTELCLKCHAMDNGRQDRSTVGERFWVGDGVGCESCHGPAERWLSEHYRWGRDFSALQKQRLGFTNLKDLRTRAEVCVSCHVGTADKDVNHDLIAAGHPRLDFEFSSALAIYPRHWQSRQDEAEAWEVGQLVSAQAALRLLAARADGQHPWPEYAEYSCYACHHELSGSPRPPTTRPPGTMPWGTWYLALTQDLVGPSKRLEALRQLMQQRLGDRASIQASARAMAEELQDRLPKQAALSTPRRLNIMRELVQKRTGRLAPLDWDDTCQLYLGLLALDPNKQDRNDPLGQELRKMGIDLRQSFSPGYDSPRRFDEKTRPHIEEHLKILSKYLQESLNP